MHPCAHLLRNVTDLIDRVEGARVYIARLDADDCGSGRTGNKRRLQPTLRISWDHVHVAFSEAEHRRGFQNCRVTPPPEDDCDRGRRKTPTPPDTPASLAQAGTARRGKSGHIRHLCTSYKCPAAIRRQMEQIEDPRQNYFFQVRRDSGEIKQTRILIPSICQPVSRNGCWHRAANYTSEESPTPSPHSRR